MASKELGIKSSIAVKPFPTLLMVAGFSSSTSKSTAAATGSVEPITTSSFWSMIGLLHYLVG